MRILITGSTGMVGRNILANKDISEFDILTPNSTELNLLNYTNVVEYIKNNRPHFIIHTAGKVGGIQANIAYPVSYLVENVDIGRNIIMAAKNNGVKYLMNIGSSCMYPKDAKNPLREEFILKGEFEPTNEGYAIAKVYTQRLLDYINREDDRFNYKTIIPCNLYGKWDKFDPKDSHMLPAVIRKIHKAKIDNISEVEIWGDGEARREFMFASDLANFIWHAIHNYDTMPDLLNVGLGYDYTINNYYDTIAKVIGYSGKFVHDLSKPVGMKQKLVDISRLNNFGWEHKHSLQDGIKKTYDFFLQNYC